MEDCKMGRKSKLILGFGYNSYGKHKSKINGKNTHIYQIWMDMIKRCNTNKQKAYLDCTVDDAVSAYKEAKELAAKEWLEVIKRDNIVVDPRVVNWLENYEYEEK